MSILVNKNSKVLVQGITGGAGSFHARQCMAYGTQVVAGVTPKKGGQRFDDCVPIFDTVQEAMNETQADVSMVFVPARFAPQAMIESAEAGIKFIVCITEGIPALDMVRTKEKATELGARILGPNCPGVITPGECKVGIMPAAIHKPGRIGVISRSGTLTYEAVDQLTRLGIGQSTCVGIGGDPVPGSTFVDILKLFEADLATDGVVMIGEIGGSAEEEAAQFIKKEMKKPVAAFIAGVTAPPGKRMGHAGAIIAGGKGTAEDKIEALTSAGARVTRNPAEIGTTLRTAMGF